MLRTDKPIYKVILVFNLLLIAAGLVLVVMAGINGGTGDGWLAFISRIFHVFPLIAAAVYLLHGYRKDAARYFRLFGISYAITEGIFLVNVGVRFDYAVAIMTSMLALCFILVMFLGENLGKVRSFILCFALIALAIIQILDATVIDPEGQKFDLIPIIVRLVLACLYGVMTCAKYLDKAERGSN